MVDQIELSELICAKICHDLAGPVGAVSNSVEFLKDNNINMHDKAQQLIEVSSFQSVARLQFFRHIYGTSHINGEANLIDCKNLVENYLKNSKTKLIWCDRNINSPDISVGNRLAKIILNLVNVSNNTLTHGGVINVSIDKVANSKIIFISSSGTNVKLEDTNLNLLKNIANNIAINAKNVHFYLTGQLIANAKLSLNIEKNDSQITFSVDVKSTT